MKREGAYAMANSKLLFAFGVLLGYTATAEILSNTPSAMAVFEFDSPYKVMRHDVSDLLIARLSEDSRVILIERSNLKKATDEQALGISEMVSSATAAKIGQLTGAK